MLSSIKANLLEHVRFETNFRKGLIKQHQIDKMLNKLEGKLAAVECFDSIIANLEKETEELLNMPSKMNYNLKLIEKLGLDVKKVNANGEISAICPLHNDKNPSLSINVITGKFQCWSGCIKGRSIQELVFKLTGETIKENYEQNWLEEFKRKLTYKGVNGYNLPAVPLLPLAIGNKGQEYLNGRGFSNETIKQWNLWWWQEEKAVVIPVAKIGFIMRYLEGEKKYKYVAGTRISDILFGIDKFSSKDGTAILVEGSLDAIWLHQNGFSNALGILGSNLSDRQIRLLQGICKKVLILMDNDDGGVKAAGKITESLKEFFIVKKCKLPEKCDPNDCKKEVLESVIGG